MTDLISNRNMNFKKDKAMLLDTITEFHSPIINIKRYLIGALENCASEKNAILYKIVTDNDIHFELTDEAEKDILKFSALVDSRIVKFSVKSLELVWCLCFAGPIIYEEYLKENHQKDDSILDPIYSIGIANQLLDWLIVSFKSEDYIKWDETLPYPKDINDNNIYQLSNELFFLAVSWLLLHEVGHIHKVHKSLLPAEKLEEENIADAFANEFMIDTIVSKNKILVRKIGIGIANLAILILGIENKKLVSDEYPHSFERLINNINYRDDYDEKFQEFTLNVICKILYRYMSKTEIPISQKIDNPYDQLVSYYQDVNRYINENR
jgi:hypothetical protein